MKKYIDYTEEDFAKDDYFIQWILDSDPSIHSFWSSWLADNPQKAEVVKKAKQIILSIDFRKFHPANEDYLRIWDAIDLNTEKFEEKKSNIKVISIYDRAPAIHGSRNPSLKPGKVAASLLVGTLFLSAILWFFLRDHQIHYATDYGEIKTIILPDNSIVKLNANSSLTFTNDWEEDNPREVWLNGEGFFSVMHKADSQKFLVHVENLRIEVLGTEFNVSNRREKARVVLNSGKVKLDFEGEINSEEPIQPIFMEPGEMVEVTKPTYQNKKFIKKKVDTNLITSWRNNQLIFKDTPINEVIHAIQDQFGIEVIVQGVSLTQHNYTGTIPLDDIDIFFTTLSKSFNVEIMKEDQRVIIRKKSRSPDI